MNLKKIMHEEFPFQQKKIIKQLIINFHQNRSLTFQTCLYKFFNPL